MLDVTICGHLGSKIYHRPHADHHPVDEAKFRVARWRGYVELPCVSWRRQQPETRQPSPDQ